MRDAEAAVDAVLAELRREVEALKVPDRPADFWRGFDLGINEVLRLVLGGDQDAT
jgi:hypothetical protein